MARVVSLTLFLLSWLLLFSYAASYSEPSVCQVCTKVVDHIYQQVQKNSAQICPTKAEKTFYPTDVADFICKIQPQIDKLANGVCNDLYPDACSLKPPSTEDGIPGQQEIAEIVNKDSDEDRIAQRKKTSNDAEKDLKEENHGPFNQAVHFLNKMLDGLGRSMNKEKDPNSKLLKERPSER